MITKNLAAEALKSQEYQKIRSRLTWGVPTPKREIITKRNASKAEEFEDAALEIVRRVPLLLCKGEESWQKRKQ
jgi:hypothetical protein